MEIKLENHVIKGILRDLTVSKFSPEFAFDALNIRLTAREDNTLLNVTNEKGTKECVIKDLDGNEVQIIGNYIGHCVLNNYLVLFTTEETDRIYRLENKKDYFESVLLYSGDLNLDILYPIETLGIFETIKVLKVYWTDNNNPIRVLNITKTYLPDSDFDIVKTIDNTSLKITKEFNNGSFGSGVIQYAVTFYDLYGSETAISCISDLQYCSFQDRGGSPEEIVNCSFNISLIISQWARNKFEYLRLYSIHRSSINATPLVKIVKDVPLSSFVYDENAGDYTLTLTDTGTIGEDADPTLLLYVGGEDLIAKTLTSKDQTLFAGNITMRNSIVPENIREEIKKASITFRQGPNLVFDYNDLDSVYPYLNSLIYNEKSIKGFKSRETYRFGILLKSKKGKWSEVVFIGDKECDINPNVLPFFMSSPLARITLTDEAISLISGGGYTSMRAVCVYPSYNDRSVICQGVLCPTVFNLQDRFTNSPYAQSSWFTRPIQYDSEYVSEYASVEIEGKPYVSPTHNILDGEVLYFQHMDSIYGSTSHITSPRLEFCSLSRGEVQSSESCSTSLLPSETEPEDYISKKRSSFIVDNGIVTMYSPDIEFDDSVGYMKDSNLKFRIIGAVMLANTLSDISITTSTQGYYTDDIGYWGNLIKNKTTMLILNAKFGSGRGMSAAPFWSALPKTENDTDIKRKMLWLVYPWHRSGSLIASGVPEDDENRLWELKRKVMSNLWFSSNTVYFDSPYEPSSGISPVNTWHSGDSLIRIKANGNPNIDYYSYYGDIDKVISYDSASNKKTSSSGSREGYGYYIYGIEAGYDSDNTYSDKFQTFNQVGKEVLSGVIASNGNTVNLKVKDALGVEPISMKYKSGPHAVFAFNYVDTIIEGKTIPTLTILPNNGNNVNDGSSGYRTLLWDNYDTTWKQDTIDFTNNNHQSFLWLGELYREIDESVRFGGNTPEAILNNTWEVASGEIPVNDMYNTILCWGDTYVLRYDALRTYEYTSEDTNSVVDILSFICETRVNISGRYDRNRGNTSNLTITPLNFNLMNPIYSLRNNYFTYHTLDYNRFSNDYFPNTIVWSKEKHNSEEIDTWTNLNMLSSLDLDGDKGEIESLNTFNNEIYCFQKRGLSNILFNSRVLIPASDGVPIEITNGLKVNGKRYISNTVGCSNKWSIAESPNGLYFIDNETNSLYLFNGQILSLSDKLGFRQWIGENNSNDDWNPSSYKNFRTYYDKTNDDVYFINDKTCLCYSELLGQFTSFMSYEKVPAMFNLGSDFYSFNKLKLWQNFEGLYNMFYGEFKPYSITVVANSYEPYDKIFSTIEFRSDSWDGNTLVDTRTFDTLEVWNEYQHGSSNLEFIKDYPSVLKKKFRIWRANIPRDDRNHRDRIRNTWAYVKLSMNSKNIWKTQFHDIAINFLI